MFLKLKQTTTWDMPEQNIIVKNVEAIMDISLKMVQNLRENDIAIMEYV